MKEIIKVVVVGDYSANKTQLLFNYASMDYSNEYCPIVFDNCSRNIDFEDKTIKLQLYDTTGQEKYKNLRSSMYRQGDVFILCFSLNNTESLSNIKDIWFPEIRSTSPESKIILVGINSDHHQRIVSTEKGEDMKAKIDADDYIECNLFEKDQIDSVFESAIKAFFHKKKKGKRKWNFFRKLTKKSKTNYDI